MMKKDKDRMAVVEFLKSRLESRCTDSIYEPGSDCFSRATKNLKNATRLLNKNETVISLYAITNHQEKDNPNLFYDHYELIESEIINKSNKNAVIASFEEKYKKIQARENPINSNKNPIIYDVLEEEYAGQYQSL